MSAYSAIPITTTTTPFVGLPTHDFLFLDFIQIVSLLTSQKEPHTPVDVACPIKPTRYLPS
jgi:hypothetical protein